MEGTLYWNIVSGTFQALINHQRYALITGRTLRMGFPMEAGKEYLHTKPLTYEVQKRDFNNPVWNAKYIISRFKSGILKDDGMTG